MTLEDIMDEAGVDIDDPIRGVTERFVDILLEDPRANSVLGQAQEGIGQFQSLLDKLGDAIERGPEWQKRRAAEKAARLRARQEALNEARKRAAYARSQRQSRYRRRQHQERQEVLESDPRHPRQQHTRAELGLPLSGPLQRSQIIQQRRKLARTHHPDKGGDPKKMQRINASVEYLLQIYRQ